MVQTKTQCCSHSDIYQHCNVRTYRGYKCKGKGHPTKDYESPQGGIEVQLYSFLNLGAR